MEKIMQLQQTDLFIWGIICGCLLTCFLIRQYQRNKRKKWLRKAKKAEREALFFLERKGYQIVAQQLSKPIKIYLNGKAHESTIRADLLVRKGWKTYIVEVKSGQQGSGTLPNVRRQLLEYALVFRPSGMLLLDMEHARLKKVEFDYERRATWQEKVLTLLLLVAISIIILLWRQIN